VASLVIRDLDDEVKARLRVRAAQRGRSMEAEAREILTAAVRFRRPARGLGSFIHAQLAEVAGTELPIPSRDTPARVADLSS
jgi:plasmid stability protein